MAISKTRVNKRTSKKTNKELVETIMLSKKENIEIAKLISGPTRKTIKKNLYEINQEAKEGETIIVPGKVLGKGEVDKKIKIIALSFSSSALEKLKKAKINTVLLKEELEKGKKIEGRILR